MAQHQRGDLNLNQEVMTTNTAKNMLLKLKSYFQSKHLRILKSSCIY